METSSDFKIFYDHQLVPHLSSLEVQRKAVAASIGVSLLAGVISLFAAIYYVAGFHEFSFSNHNNLDFLFALLLIVLWAIAGVLVYKKIFEKKLADIRSRFKRSVISKIVDFVDPDLSYFENKLITKGEYDDSKIFPVSAHWYYGEDYLLGSDKEVSYKASEIHSQYVMKDHRGRKLFLTIFHGLFFIADIQHQYKSETIVLPDTAHKLFGPFGDAIQKMNVFRDKVIRTGNKEFDKEFVVYGNDEIESKKVLTDNLINRISDFRKKSGNKVYLSFIGSKVNLAIPLKQDLFEPPVFGSMLNYDAIHENYKYLKLATFIVKDLGLND